MVGRARLPHTLSRRAPSQELAADVSGSEHCPPRSTAHRHRLRTTTPGAGDTSRSEPAPTSRVNPPEPTKPTVCAKQLRRRSRRSHHDARALATLPAMRTAAGPGRSALIQRANPIARWTSPSLSSGLSRPSAPVRAYGATRLDHRLLAARTRKCSRELADASFRTTRRTRGRPEQDPSNPLLFETRPGLV